MKWLVAVLSVLSATLPDTYQERPRVPADSVQLEIIGCLKGRLLRASDLRYVDTQSGPDVRSRSFRLAGKREVMNHVKRENGHVVEVTGLIKRSALDDRGVKSGGRIEIGGGPPVSRTGIASLADTVPVMDVLSIRRRSTSCGT